MQCLSALEVVRDERDVSHEILESRPLPPPVESADPYRPLG
jgi:hypothetical protein